MPFRPSLRPGAALLRRDATHLQIGTSPGIVISDRPGLAALLRLLDGVRQVERLQAMASRDIPELGRPVTEVLTELVSAGAVVDATLSSETVRSRSARTIRVESAPGTSELAAALRRVLSAVGIGSQASSDPELLVVLSVGETARASYERAAVIGLDHLPVVIDEDRVRIGPFVRPGRTPCVSCHDLHRADWDPAWPALLHQLGSTLPRGGPSALDPLTAQAAAVEVVAEVLTALDAGAPRTLARCLVTGPRHDERAIWPVTFHHRCSCDLLSAA